MPTILFYLGFAALLTHEMDAIAHKEWRILYFFRKLPENIASSLFIAIHVPAIAFLIGLAHHELSIVQQGTRVAISLFLVVHAILHKRLEQHPQYTFHTLLSKSLIYGGGLLGLLYVVALSWR